MIQRYLMKSYWNATSIPDMWGLHAEVHPHKEAPVAGNTRMTFVECKRWMDRVALGLHELGIKPDDAVFRQLPNSAEAILAPLACEKAGTIACSAVKQLRHQEVEYILQKTEAVAGKIKIDGDSNLAQMLLDRPVSKIGGRE
jgi:2,3-dihydroxybenzoate-AMP ligase